MSFVIGRISDVDLDKSKVNFYDLAIDKIGAILKDMSKLTNKEAVVMFGLMHRLIDKEENQINLDDNDMEFVRKYIGDIS